MINNTKGILFFSRFVQELSGHLATYDEFLKTAGTDLAKTAAGTTSRSGLSPTSPTSAAAVAGQSPKTQDNNLTMATVAEARRQFSRMLKVDAWELVKGSTYTIFRSYGTPHHTI